MEKLRIPFMSIKSKNQGPVLWLTACSHGEEIISNAVIRGVFKKLKNKKNKLCKGVVYAFPIMNPPGFKKLEHNIPFTDEDLNRNFPGKNNGTLAEKLAYKIFNKITKTKPDLVLDLHNDWKNSVPYALIDYDKKINKKIYEKIKIHAKKTGFLVIFDTKNIKKTLTYNLIKKRVRALVLELGESYVINKKDVENGVKAIENILVSLGMIRKKKNFKFFIHRTKKINKILKYYEKPYSSKKGRVEFLVKSGEIVKKGKKVAKIYDISGKPLETLRALKKGVVISCTDDKVVSPKKPIIAFGVA